MFKVNYSIVALQASLATLAMMFVLGNSSQAQVCTPLSVVKGQGTSVDKKVSTPDLLIVGDNWNTDFAVPSNRSFRQFIATLRSKSTQTELVNVEVFLKYSNGTADRSFGSDVRIPAGKSHKVFASPRLDEQPYQVNVKVGDIDSVGFDYNVSVSGCSREQPKKN